GIFSRAFLAAPSSWSAALVRIEDDPGHKPACDYADQAGTHSGQKGIATPCWATGPYKARDRSFRHDSDSTSVEREAARRASNGGWRGRETTPVAGLAYSL